MSNRTKTRKAKLHQTKSKPVGRRAPPLDGVEEKHHTLFFALHNYFRNKLGSGSSMAEIHHIVVGELTAMKVGEASIGWDVAEHATIPECHRQAKRNRPLRVLATVAEINAPVLVPVCGADGEVFAVEAVCASFIDRAGNSIRSLDITGDGLIERLHSLKRGGQAELLCVPVALPLVINRKQVEQSLQSEPRGFFLHVADLRRSHSTLDQLGASGVERRAMADVLAKFAAEGVRPSDCLEQLVITNLNIVGLDDFRLLRMLIRFTVRQALSSGRIDAASGRLHCMVVGPPGQGKGLLSLAARALNPVCEEVSSTKVSAAGLVGASSQAEGRWVSQPGAFPRATGGVVVIEDANGWNRSVVNHIAPILQAVMENGAVCDSVAAGQEREAQTAILIDLNRTSQVGSMGVAVPTSMEAAILQVRPVLSRMDLLCDIPVDVGRSWEVARHFKKSNRTDTVPWDERPWVRQARLLVAALRDRHPEVNLDPVRALMDKAYEQIRASNADLFKSRPELADLPARMQLSFAKFVSASARGRDSSAAEPVDVDEAVTFISMKLEFFKMRGMSWVASSGERRETPTEFVARNFRGQEVGSSEAREAYQQATGRSADERTFRRALLALGGVRTTKGRYVLPPRG